MLRTRLTEEYKLTHPIVSAGMGFLATPQLVAAVSNAGGLGLLGVSPLPPPAMQMMIQAIRAMTERPFGVDFVVADTLFGPSTTDEHIDVCVKERVPLVVFFWNLPSSDWVNRLLDAGVKVWVQVGSSERAKQAVELGASTIIVQGSEAGGHNHSNVTLFSLVPAVAAAIAPVPVIAAGGIVDGRGLAAALALGAEGVCVGTRFIASREANAHQEYQRRILAAKVGDVARTCIFGPEWPDQPMRVLRNRVVAEWEGRDERTPPQPEPPQFIGKTLLGGQEYPMPKFSAALPTPDTTGDFEEMCIAAGEGAGLISKIKSAAEIVQEIAGEAERLISGRLAGLTRN